MKKWNLSVSDLGSRGVDALSCQTGEKNIQSIGDAVERTCALGVRKA
jgi:hypothetical protein